MRNFGIERGQRLIEQEDVGLKHQRARQGDALALAAGELRGAAGFLAGEADQFQGFAHAAIDLCGAMTLETELHVAARGEVRKQGVILEHGADVALIRLALIDDLAVEQDVAGGGLLEAGDQAQRGGLAASGRAQQGEETAPRNGERDVTDRLLAGKVLHQLA